MGTWMHGKFQTLYKYLLEAERLVRDLEEDLDSIHGCHNRLGQHAGQPARDDSLQSNHHIIAVMLHTHHVQQTD